MFVNPASGERSTTRVQDSVKESNWVIFVRKLRSLTKLPYRDKLSKLLNPSSGEKSVTLTPSRDKEVICVRFVTNVRLLIELPLKDNAVRFVSQCHAQPSPVVKF